MFVPTIVCGSVCACASDAVKQGVELAAKLQRAATLNITSQFVEGGERLLGVFTVNCCSRGIGDNVHDTNTLGHTYIVDDSHFTVLLCTMLTKNTEGNLGLKEDAVKQGVELAAKLQRAATLNITLQFVDGGERPAGWRFGLFIESLSISAGQIQNSRPNFPQPTLLVNRCVYCSSSRIGYIWYYT
eukprot:sb/3471355/